MKSLYLLLFLTHLQSLTLSRLIPLPRGVLVEGVAHAGGSNFFAADLANGQIYLVDVNTNLTTTVARPGPNRTSVGISASSRLLFAAGGGPFGESVTGTGPSAPIPSLNVYEIVTGNIVASCIVPQGGIVNDVIVSESEGYAYFTDSVLGFLYQLSLQALPRCQVRTIELPRDLFSGFSTSANGIVSFRGGLIVAHSELGALFFVDLQNDNRVQRLVRNGTVAGADGLDLVERRGETLLYVTENGLDRVSVWRVGMRRRVVSTQFVERIVSDEFAFPTTVAVGAGRLVVPNARFDEVIRNGSIVDVSDMMFTLSVQQV